MLYRISGFLTVELLALALSMLVITAGFFGWCLVSETGRRGWRILREFKTARRAIHKC
jgi:hypothetical protein